jgi:hypothetical protein
MDWTNEAEVKRTQVILEQYKICITDLGSIGTRYEAAHKLYFSLLGATVAVLTLTEQGKVLPSLEREVLWITVAFGVALCLLWLSATNYYSALFRAKFRVIRELETDLPVAPYTKQTEYLSGSEPASTEPGMRVRALIKFERLIPIVFIFLLIGLAVFGGAR